MFVCELESIESSSTASKACTIAASAAGYILDTNFFELFEQKLHLETFEITLKALELKELLQRSEMERGLRGEAERAQQASSKDKLACAKS